MASRFDIETYIRDVPDFPKKGIIFKDITPLLEDGKAFRKVIKDLYAHYRDKKIDKVVAIESRGYIFGAPLAEKLGAGLVIARKPGKLPCKSIRESYSLEYGTAALEMHQDAIKKNERVLIIDDLLATGGTAQAVRQMVLRLGGKVVEFAFIIELGMLGGRRKLLPSRIFTLLSC
jgi:adenine phosphoribosyltransferase